MCLQCIERILLSRRAVSYADNEYDDPDELIFSAPTMGRCPICRGGMSLFDLKDVRSRKVLYEKDCNFVDSELAGLVFAQADYIEEGSDGVDAGSFHFPSWDDAADGPDDDSGKNEKETDIVAGDGGNAEGGPPATKVKAKTKAGHPLPYVSFESSLIDQQRDVWNLDNGMRPPRKKYFEDGCHYHAKSRTFHGKLVWCRDGVGSTYDTSSSWDLIMQFSSDLRYISNGILVKRRDAPFHRSLPTSSSRNSDDEQHYSNPWPFDGRWKVNWYEPKSGEAHFTIVAGSFEFGPTTYRINISNPECVEIVWPRGNIEGEEGVVQTAVSGLNLAEQPDGPDVGSLITWTTDHRDYPKITWTRETVAGPPPPKVELFGPQNVFYRRARVTCDRFASLIPRYHGDDVWGNVFVQQMKVGLASYHFLSEPSGQTGDYSEAYISYEHPYVSQWPNLDDGSPVPSRVPFSGITWDRPGRTFRATIEWHNRYSTTWNGCARWRYEMVFDKEFTCILSGGVWTTPFDIDGDEGKEKETEMSAFGESLVYVNAAVLERFREMLLSSQEEGPVEISGNHSSPNDSQDGDSSEIVQFARASRSLRDRLSVEGASFRTMTVMHRLLASTQQQPASNPIDYNL